MTATTDAMEEIAQQELLQEQQYFDEAKECLDRAVASRSMTSGGTGRERQAIDASMRRRQSLGHDEPVAFGRLDLEDAEVRYIGRVAIRDESREILVYQWQSPAAIPFEQARMSQPMGTARRRSFTTSQNKIESFEDELFQQLSADFRQLEEIKMETDPLLEELNRTRGEFMQDIVRSIQAEQSRLIRSDKDQLLVIQGGPGTGKTAVALHRVSWLLYNYQTELQAGDILVVGPNMTFTKYMNKVLPDLGDEGIIQRALPQLLAGTVLATAHDDVKAARLKGSAVMGEIIYRAINGRVRVPVQGMEIKRRNSGLTISVSSEEIQKILKSLKEGTYNSRRLKFKELLQKVATKNVKGFRPGHAVSTLDSNSLDAELDRIWPQSAPTAFLRDLYASKDRLKKAGASDSQAETLYRKAEARIGDVAWTHSDLAVLDLVSHSLSGVEKQYKHIVVDEAQDLSTLELRSIQRRSRNGSMTIVGDIAQATSPYSTNSWELALKQLSVEGVSSNLDELKIGYRVPKTVLDVAAKALNEAAPGVRPPEVFRDVENAVRWHVPSANELTGCILDVVQRSGGNGLFTGVIAQEQDLDLVRGIFQDNSIQWSEARDGDLSRSINLATPDQAKGLEFDSVIVIDPQRVIDAAQGYKLLYIALTRTVRHLDVIVPDGKMPTIFGEYQTPTAGRGDVDEKPAVLETIEIEALVPPVRALAPDVNGQESSDATAAGTHSDVSRTEGSQGLSANQGQSSALNEELGRGTISGSPNDEVATGVLVEEADIDIFDFDSREDSDSQAQSADSGVADMGSAERNALPDEEQDWTGMPHKNSATLEDLKEALAQTLAAQIMETLNEEATSAVQRRVLTILSQKLVKTSVG